MTKKIEIIIGVSLIVIALGLTIWQQLYLSHANSNPASSGPKVPPPTTQPTKPDPLTINYLRTRQYDGGTITTTQNLGNQGGYQTAVISFTSDGLREYALQATPNGAKPAGGWPVIILNHGYINPANYQTNGSDYRDWIATLARAGFVVIKPDYRGHGQSQGQPEGGHFSTAYAVDDLNLITALSHDDLVNVKRLGLIGHSLGGHVTLRVDVTSPQVRASAFVNGVVGSFNDIFYNWPHSPMPNDQPLPLVQGLRQSYIQKYGEPKDNPAFWDSASAINFVQYVAGPVQVNHDVNDTTVPYLFSQHLVTALQTAGKSVAFYSYPGDDHQFASSANHDLLMQRLTSFFKANL